MKEYDTTVDMFLATLQNRQHILSITLHLGPAAVQEDPGPIAEAHQCYIETGVWIEPSRMLIVSSHATLPDDILTFLMTVSRIAKQYGGEPEEPHVWPAPGHTHAGAVVIAFPPDEVAV